MTSEICEETGYGLDSDLLFTHTNRFLIIQGEVGAELKVLF